MVNRKGRKKNKTEEGKICGWQSVESPEKHIIEMNFWPKTAAAQNKKHKQVLNTVWVGRAV